jgi:hypothetical protein
MRESLRISEGGAMRDLILIRLFKNKTVFETLVSAVENNTGTTLNVHCNFKEHTDSGQMYSNASSFPNI